MKTKVFYAGPSDVYLQNLMDKANFTTGLLSDTLEFEENNKKYQIQFVKFIEQADCVLYSIDFVLKEKQLPLLQKLVDLHKNKQKILIYLYKTKEEAILHQFINTIKLQSWDDRSKLVELFNCIYNAQQKDHHQILHRE